MMPTSFFHIDCSVKPGWLIISGNCVFTGVGYAVGVKEVEWEAYRAGAMAQDAFPTLPIGDREFLISGISPTGWDEAFPDPGYNYNRNND